MALSEELGRIGRRGQIVREILGMPHGRIPIQLDLWGREVFFRGRGQTTLY